jgi:hypothetical protein
MSWNVATAMSRGTTNPGNGNHRDPGARRHILDRDHTAAFAFPQVTITGYHLQEVPHRDLAGPHRSEFILFPDAETAENFLDHRLVDVFPGYFTNRVQGCPHRGGQ